MRRGFETEAHELAVEVRSEINVGRYDSLDPWLLAATSISCLDARLTRQSLFGVEPTPPHTGRPAFRNAGLHRT